MSWGVDQARGAMNEDTRPKPLFYVVVGLVVLGLLLYGLRGILFPKKQGSGPGQITKEELTQAQGVEAPDANAPTTVKEYTFKASEKLPPIAQTSGYEPMVNRTVKFALNVWAGWAPIILQNEGGAAGKAWTTPGGEPFKVELVLDRQPGVDARCLRRRQSAHRLGHARHAAALHGRVEKGSAHHAARFPAGRFLEWRRRDRHPAQRRARSEGADDRRPPEKEGGARSEFPLGVFPPQRAGERRRPAGGSELRLYRGRLPGRCGLQQRQKSIAACVSWAPDIYNLSKIEGNHMLVSTATANKLIADVWFARGDFARDHRDICEGLVRGIFDGMAQMKSEAGRKQAAAHMAKLYSIPEADTLGMLGDAHSTNYAENREFFMNQNNPANFERTWNTAYLLYRKMNRITQQVPFDQVMDFSILQKLANEEPYKSSRNEYQINFAPKTVQEIKAEGSEILTKVVTLHFYPNSWDLRKTITVRENGVDVTKLYEPGVDTVLEEVGKLAAQYGAANILVEGHTDSSMRGQVSPQMVKDLSNNRAAAVKTELLKKFPNFNVNQFTADGLGWERAVRCGRS